MSKNKTAETALMREDAIALVGESLGCSLEVLYAIEAAKASLRESTMGMQRALGRVVSLEPGEEVSLDLARIILDGAPDEAFREVCREVIDTLHGLAVAGGESDEGSD